MRLPLQMIGAKRSKQLEIQLKITLSKSKYYNTRHVLGTVGLVSDTTPPTNIIKPKFRIHPRMSVKVLSKTILSRAVIFRLHLLDTEQNPYWIDTIMVMGVAK